MRVTTPCRRPLRLRRRGSGRRRTRSPRTSPVRRRGRSRGRRGLRGSRTRGRPRRRRPWPTSRIEDDLRRVLRDDARHADCPEKSTSSESAPSQSAACASRPTARPPTISSRGMPMRLSRSATAKRSGEPPRRPGPRARRRRARRSMSPTCTPVYGGRPGTAIACASSPPQSPRPTKTR